MMKFKMFRTSGLVTRDDRLIFLSRNDERTTRDRLFDYFLIFIVFFFSRRSRRCELNEGDPGIEWERILNDVKGEIDEE